VSLPSPREMLAKPLVRLACAALGVGLLTVTVWAAGARAVLEGLGGSIHAMPAVVALEAGMLVCSTLALRALYGDEAARVSPRQWLRAGAMGFAVGAVLPIGRATAEATRAVLLRKSVGGARAAVAAVQMQGVALIANAFLSLLALSAALVVLGFGGISTLILVNGVLAALIGGSILIVRQSGSPGRLLGGLAKRGRTFGLAFDAAAGASRRSLFHSLAWESAARGLQTYQCTVALAAIGRPSGLMSTLVARGVLLVGGALGDFIPAQLGATEATLVVGAAALGLTAATAAALALLIHGAQLALALLCAAVAFAVPGAPGLSRKALEAEP
jgi:Lysylphosphatidylglycerol synthase TM region